MIDRRLNSAGRLAEIFVSSKLTVLFMLACALLGLLAMALTPREENPQIVVPGAEVRVALLGASPEEVEELVIRPLEGIVKQIPGVDHTYATAMNSLGVLMVQFKVGENKEKSLVKLYDRVLGQRDRLPLGAMEPLIRSVDVDDVPIVTVTLASERYDDYALKRLADRMLEGLRSLEAVSTTFVQGGRDREMRIELDPQRLQSFGVTLDQVRAFLSAGNVAAPLGTVVQQGENRQVYLDGFLASAEELGRLIVGNHAGRPIYLGEVARVVDGPPDERDKLSRLAFGPADARFGKAQQAEMPAEMPAVTLAVAKKAGTNAVVVADEVLARIERMRAQFVPADVELVVTRNDGQKADAAVNGLIEHLGIAVLAVFLVTAVFLGLKEALIVGVTVPLILALTLGAAFLAGLTINRVSLFALILIVMNVVYAASAYPFGMLSDKVSRRTLLVWGVIFLIAADIVLALAANAWAVGLGAAIWGLHMGATQGLLSALVAGAAPADLRGTAFGVFNLVSGVALLAASVIAGGLWTWAGPAMTFYVGAAFSLVALAGLLAPRRAG